MAQSDSLKEVIDSVRQLTKSVDEIRTASRSPVRAMGNMSQAAGRIGDTVQGGFSMMAGIADANAQLEDLQITLENVEGSAEKGRQSLDWIGKFKETSAFQLTEVTDAFVRLRMAGIDPQAGALKAAGEAAAALGRPFGQAAAALADALAGDDKLLREFGINTERVGKEITYKWRENGKNMRLSVDANDTAAQLAAIESIWKGSFDGAMARRSQTWNGMWSNMEHSFLMFMKAIGDTGLFDVMKNEMRELLGLFRQWEADGSIQAAVLAIQTVVKAIGGWRNALIVLKTHMNLPAIVGILEMIEALGTLSGWVSKMGGVLFPILRRAISSMIGSLGGMKGALVRIIAASWAWTVALLANPITWIVAGMLVLCAVLFALVAGIAWAVTHWDAFKAKMAEVGEAIMGGFGAALDWAATKLQAFAGWALDIWDGIKGVFFDEKGGEVRARIAFGTEQMRMPSAANGNVEAALGAATAFLPPASLLPPVGGVGGGPGLAGASSQPLMGEIKVTFDNAPPGMRVSPGQTNYPGLALNPNAGYRSMAVAG